METFVSPGLGREHRAGREFAPRHRHARPYAAIVLTGGYEEAGDLGRYHVRAGEALIHSHFEAHLDRFTAAGAEIFNLELPDDLGARPALVRVDDPDALVRLGERDPRAAVKLLLATVKPMQSRVSDWPDELAAALIRNPEVRLSDWAREQGLANATVSRGFRRVFGVSPCAFRARVRSRQAWCGIVTSQTPLARLAADLGFADQAHMTRAVRMLTGLPARAWRRPAGQMDSRTNGCGCLT
jgi:AraC-like DNA-binding protein